MIDNGSEFTSQVVDQWAYQNQVQLHFITPGRPMKNGFIESFNGRFRSAFSLELHVKCLILIEGSVAGRLHDLDKLFYKLAPDSQKKIRDCYAQKKPIFPGDPNVPKADFDSVLLASANAFEQFRYHFEGVPSGSAGWLVRYSIA